MKKENEDERILMSLKKSRRSFIPEYFCGFFLFGSLTFLFLKGIKINHWVNLFVVGLALFSIGSAEVSRQLHRCRVTPSKLVIIDGLIRQNRKHIYMTGISDIHVKQGIIARLLNYGVIHIKSMSGEGSLEIKNVTRPGRKMEELENIIEKYKKK